MVRSLAALSLVLFFAPLVRADDFKWDPKKKHKPEVGYKHAVEVEEHQKQNVRVSVEKKVVQKQDEDVTVDYKFVREVVKVEGDKATEQKFTIEKWTRTEGADGEADTSLAGKTVIVKGGDEPKWECADSEKLSEGAKGWIQKELVSKKKKGADENEDDKMQKLMGPEKPVGDGEEWSRDPAAFAKELFGPDTEIDAAKSSIKGKVSDVKVEDGVHVGHVDIKIAIVFASSQKFSEGGTMDAMISVDGSLELDKRDEAKVESKMTFKIANKQQTKNGTVDVKVKGDNSEKKTEGPAK